MSVALAYPVQVKQENLEDSAKIEGFIKEEPPEVKEEHWTVKIRPKDFIEDMKSSALTVQQNLWNDICGKGEQNGTKRTVQNKNKSISTMQSSLNFKIPTVKLRRLEMFPKMKPVIQQKKGANNILDFVESNTVKLQNNTEDLNCIPTRSSRAVRKYNQKQKMPNSKQKATNQKQMIPNGKNKTKNFHQNAHNYARKKVGNTGNNPINVRITEFQKKPLNPYILLTQMDSASVASKLTKEKRPRIMLQRIQIDFPKKRPRIVLQRAEIDFPELKQHIEAMKKRKTSMKKLRISLSCGSERTSFRRAHLRNVQPMQHSREERCVKTPICFWCISNLKTKLK